MHYKQINIKSLYIQKQGHNYIRMYKIYYHVQRALS